MLYQFTVMLNVTGRTSPERIAAALYRLIEHARETDIAGAAVIDDRIRNWAVIHAPHTPIQPNR